jgi:hypothetical protein
VLKFSAVSIVALLTVVDKLYKTGGLLCGFPVNTGVNRTAPLEAVNGNLIFAAYAPHKGSEPHAFDGSPEPMHREHHCIANSSTDCR